MTFQQSSGPRPVCIQVDQKGELFSLAVTDEDKCHRLDNKHPCLTIKATFMDELDTMDSAIYMGVTNATMRVDVTSLLNKRIAKFGINNITHGQSLTQVFGDPAPGQYKKLVVRKGGAAAEFHEKQANYTYDLSPLKREGQRFAMNVVALPGQTVALGRHAAAASLSALGRREYLKLTLEDTANPECSTDLKLDLELSAVYHVSTKQPSGRHPIPTSPKPTVPPTIVTVVIQQRVAVITVTPKTSMSNEILPWGMDLDVGVPKFTVSLVSEAPRVEVFAVSLRDVSLRNARSA